MVFVLKECTSAQVLHTLRYIQYTIGYEEFDKMFPVFIYDESFLADIEKQREEHNTFQNNRRNCSFHHEYSEQAYYEEQTYDKYCGSYAQDEMGYSDDDIDTIFDGDPDAYWNID